MRNPDDRSSGIGDPVSPRDAEVPVGDLRAGAGTLAEVATTGDGGS